MFGSLKKILIAILLLIAFLFPAYIGFVHIAAQKGSSTAQGELGYWYDKGEWLHPKNREKAFYWYQKSASQNDYVAQFNLGVMMANEGNFKLAAGLYLHSALQNYDAAQNNLANLYREGKGVKQNSKTANFWLEKAAVQGNGFAQYSLGKAYAKGDGVIKNDSKAFYWIEKAAHNNIATAQTHLGMLFMLGTGVPANDDLALEWAEKGLLNGDLNAKKIIKLIKEIKSS